MRHIIVTIAVTLVACSDKQGETVGDHGASGGQGADQPNGTSHTGLFGYPGQSTSRSSTPSPVETVDVKDVKDAKEELGKLKDTLGEHAQKAKAVVKEFEEALERLEDCIKTIKSLPNISESKNKDDLKDMEELEIEAKDVLNDDIVKMNVISKKSTDLISELDEFIKKENSLETLKDKLTEVTVTVNKDEKALKEFTQKEKVIKERLSEAEVRISELKSGTLQKDHKTTVFEGIFSGERDAPRGKVFTREEFATLIRSKEKIEKVGKNDVLKLVLTAAYLLEKRRHYLKNAKNEIEQKVNKANRLLAHSTRISSLFEGSKNSKIEALSADVQDIKSTMDETYKTISRIIDSNSVDKYLETLEECGKKLTDSKTNFDDALRKKCVGDSRNTLLFIELYEKNKALDEHFKNAREAISKMESLVEQIKDKSESYSSDEEDDNSNNESDAGVKNGRPVLTSGAPPAPTPEQSKVENKSEVNMFGTMIPLITAVFIVLV
ncbi:hypothetical protein BEWA_047010 [Theileria equi strain WA]|uniref:Signal peptide containing protein n=1 Tax=Theileria equi strain WA TaxID=1537102 RepID=L1L9X5_THEEQ|nr:hypothetical protein BEWA_047010 [Theileria equi strain WA]EKX72237.1 hypothetical protein BEWA_047010 [Theileria equi strain WA]|eukprot:XP_004831689.1 hypothetical protein BEWA_047010 [Theileria equi strain WA]